MNYKKFLVTFFTIIIFVSILYVRSNAITIEEKGSITVSNIESEVKVSIYKLTNVNYDYEIDQPIEPPYEWNENVKQYLKSTENQTPDYSRYVNPRELYDNIENNSIEAAQFYDKLASAIKGENLELEPVQEKTTEGKLAFPIETNSEVVFDNLDMGTYLIIIENGYMVYRPSIINITPEFDTESEKWKLSNPEVEIKASIINIDKTINEDLENDDKVSTTDVINFDIRADIPQYLESSLAKDYYISDKFSEGLTLMENSIKVYGVNGTKETLLNEEEEYILTNERPNNLGTATFILKFDYEKIKQYEKIHVDYNAKLNTDESIKIFEEENPNNAYLDYSNNPYDKSTWKTQEDKEKVYTYELEITKVDKEDNSIILTGAEFTLSKDSEGKENLTFIKRGDGIYYKSNENGATTNLIVGTTGENKGKLILRGLDIGKYYLIETKAPNEYNKLTTSKELEIKDKNAMYLVENNKGFQLPITGGMGTTILKVIGSIFIGIGIILFIIYKKRKNNSK